FVEKYFFDTPETATTVDISTFIEGGFSLLPCLSAFRKTLFLIANVYFRTIVFLRATRSIPHALSSDRRQHMDVAVFA
ncbi:hypothetical protein, partial [Parageobacillus thermoglucosidasius]|uniref:hypothetical protein n=1 Tax=Parageobacillus thermoglucosidasius TaxID=1426 RepID=UPI0030C67737